MSITLSADERIVKSYDYATVQVKGIAKRSETKKSLIVTNKRIIQREVTSGIGTEGVRMREMPLKAAKYVNTYYGMKSYTMLLIMGILLALMAIISLFAVEGGAGLRIVAFLVIGVIAAVCIVLYLFKKDYVVTCSIQAEGFITPAMSCSSRAGDSRTTGARRFLRSTEGMTTLNVKVKVNKEEAKALAEELGSVISMAVSGSSEVPQE